ncbi:MAG: hypothetical protein ABR552_05750 [Actinomycetota bacterium]
MSTRMDPWETRASEYVVKDPPWLTVRHDHIVTSRGHEIDGYWSSSLAPARHRTKQGER